MGSLARQALSAAVCGSGHARPQGARVMEYARRGRAERIRDRKLGGLPTLQTQSLRAWGNQAAKRTHSLRSVILTWRLKSREKVLESATGVCDSSTNTIPKTAKYRVH